MSVSYGLFQLPEELLVEILLKLPVKSLLALRHVCQWFNTYIPSESFVRIHLEHWRNHDFETKNVFIRKPTMDRNRFYREFYTTALCQEIVQGISKDFLSNCRFLLQRGSELQFGGSYDGILCFYEFQNTMADLVIYIFNPALGEGKIIPRGTEYWTMRNKNTKVCLVPDLDDYKVVVVSLSKGFHESKVWIYSLNDGCWRDNTPTFSACTHKRCISDLVTHNRFLYWMIQTDHQESCCNVLKVLDLHQESVREIVIPDYYPSQRNLMRYKGRLALCLEAPSPYMESFELCVMEEEGGDVINWGKPIRVHVGVPLPWRFCCKMQSSPTSWGYLQKTEEDDVYFMGNLDNSRLEKFIIPEHAKTRSRFCVTADYIPSLVSVFKKKCQETTKKRSKTKKRS